MMQLKATKTSLYLLVRDATGIEMPKPRDTVFYKTPRTPSYWLRWYGVECYLTATLGKALLAVKADGERKVYRISIDDLKARGMVEEH
jgi:hypothetical protein